MVGLEICVVLGTRPEIIKLSPVIRECSRQKLDFFVLHTGQHYSYSMDRVFFEQLRLPEARYCLEAGSSSHGEQTGKMLTKIERVLSKERPHIVLVEGDTNTVLAGALAAAKLGICVGHVEAGLRSYDWLMPEEINRVLTDHCSTLLFAPTAKAKQVLINEGVSKDRVFVTGNTVVDAIMQNLKIAKSKSDVLQRFEIEEHKYCLVTVHRQENVDSQVRFNRILQGLNKVAETFDMPVIYPVHPRAQKQLEAFGLDAGNIRLVEPADYMTFLQLEARAALILTDSGGVQEEACILGVPCVTLRYNTERPETIEVGSNILAGTEPSFIVEKAGLMLKKPRGWNNPFGDGNAGKRTVQTILEEYEGDRLKPASMNAVE